MSTLPAHSVGVLFARVDDVAALYVIRTETLHLINDNAAVVWDACDGATQLHDLVYALASSVADPITTVEQDVRRCIEQLEAIGAVGSTEHRGPSTAASIAPAGSDHRSSFAVIDEVVAFASADRVVVEAIVEWLAAMAIDAVPTVEYRIDRDAEGFELVCGEETSTHGSLEDLLSALPTKLNELAARSTRSLVLHAGAVASSAGVLLLPASSGSGKSTLTAALVQQGMTYVTDEAVGLRGRPAHAIAYAKPLSLDRAARKALGLLASTFPDVPPSELGPNVDICDHDAGHVTAIIIPRFERGARFKLSEPLSKLDAFIAVLEHALNLATVGQPGFDVLAELATSVPVRHLVHGGVDEAVPLLTHLVATEVNGRRATVAETDRA